MARFSLPEIPQPQTFFYVFSLRSGAELITMTILINKISGFYGLLAILTGYYLSPLQLSMYIYSLIALFATLYLLPHIRKQSPLQCLSLAYLYAIDSAINVAYTAAFGVAWFYVLANHPDNDSVKAPGSGTIEDTSGFTSAEYNVSHVSVHPVPAPGLKGEQSAVTYGSGVGASNPAGIGSALFQAGSVASISSIVALWTIRVYFMVIMFAYARTVLRQHIATTSSTQTWQQTSTDEDGNQQPNPYAPPSSDFAENPFAAYRDEGRGWQGKLGRAMIVVAPQYWLGPDPDTEWASHVGGKFRRNIALQESRTAARQDERPLTAGERERRRRSGTGPPAPTIKLPKLAGQKE